MMPLAPERSTMCVPTKPKADFSIDFIVGNNNNNNKSPARKGASSPLSARHAAHPYSRTPTTTSPCVSPGGPASPESSHADGHALEEDEVRARLLSIQAAQSAQAASLPGAGALLFPPLGAHLGPMGGLGPVGHPHHPLRSPLRSPSQPAVPTSPSASPSPPNSPLSPLSPPHHHQQHHQVPQPFLLRGLYRPEPMLMPPQLHPHLQMHLHPGHPAAHHGVHHPAGPQGPPGPPGMGGPQHPHAHMGGPPKDSYPLYPWLLSRHGRIFPHRFPGVAGPDFAGFLLHPFRKPKRIRTAFSPSQLLKLEHAFENNHYVVGAERKQVAQALGLSETQVKVWFQNRRTKHKRSEQEEEAKRKTGGSNNNNNNKQESSSSNNNNNSSTSSSAWKEEMDDRASPSLSHRPVDLSSHDDSSGMESES